ncbi:Sec63 Brl domain family protein [Leishmania donovani]|uniref:DNA 3'-5' helicase n=1 Tax=Leishmania donovani TaxID=5661 RepID=A0A504X703_LEIDO|nr:Sec63 Brl domain family protein [Leishmania donovani]
MSTPAAKCLGGLLHFLPHRCFTKVQEAVIPALFTNDRNCLVAAPTGSGKTVLLEVAMLRLFRNVLAPRDDAGARATEEDGETRSCSGPLQQRKRKAVYICPIKALANEKYEHWRAQFPTLTVVIETGDQQQQQVDQQERSCSTASATGDVRGRDGLESMVCVSQADILVTTPERWDSITRRWKEKEVMAIVNSVGLLLLDEVHTVQEERGAAMEAIVSRVKVIQASSSAMHQHSATETAPTRIIAISGTLPNSGDLAEWLEVSPEMTFAFAPSDRPVPLTIRVIGYAHDSPNPFAFHRFLSFKIFGFMQQYSQGRPTLVFCASRKETTSSAQRIVEDIRDAAARRGQEDRQLVERMFREQYIADMPVSEVMQMCGRAGRPGCDTHGVALVLTMQRSVHLYETLTSGAVTLTCVESHLHRHMIEHVNAEVALRTIHSFPSAMEWLKTTFFWIRLRKCPPHYGLEFANRAEELEFNAEAFVEALMERALRVLMEEGCVHLSHLDTLVLSAARGTAAPVATGDMEDIKHPSAVFEATRLGRAMSRMYILFDTVCTLNARLKARGAVSTNGDAPDDDSGVDACAGAMDVSVKTTARTGSMSVAEVHEYSHAKKDTSSEGMQPHSTAADATVCSSRRPMMPFNLREVLQLLCHCQELVEVRLRQGDRGPLNELNKTVKYPLHSGRRGGREVREDWQKAYVLIQVHIGLLPLTEVSLRNDSLRLWAVVPRMSRFLEEYAWAATTSYSLATQANLLARCIERRVWPDGLVLRQLKHVSDSVAKALLRGGYSTFESLGSVNARQLEVLCSRLPPFGSQILSEVRRLPRISLDISFMASPAESDGIDNQHRVPSGVVQLTLSPGTEAVTDEGVPNAARRQRSETASSKAAGGKPQLLSDVVALDSTRVLLLVGMPSEDRVLLKRFVPLSAFGSPDAPGSTAEAASGGGGRGRRIEARCLVLRVVGMDTVTARDEEFTSARGDAASESIHRSAQKPVANGCVLFPAAKDVAILPYTKAPQTALSVQVASEARATFNELLEDLQYVASAGDPTQPYRSAPREPPISRKRTRIGQRACRATDDDQGMQKKETRQTNGNTAAMPLPSAMANATSLLPVPGASDLREADGSGAAGAAASEVSQERAAAGGSSLDSVRSSPEHCADKGARLEKPLRDQNTPQHVSEFPSKPVRESPSPRQARLCPSLETGAADALAVSTPSAAHKRVARVRSFVEASAPSRLRRHTSGCHNVSGPGTHISVETHDSTERAMVPFDGGTNAAPEAFYYPVDPQQAPPVMRYAFSGVQGEWWRPSYMQDSSWMHGGAASPHPYPYHTPSMVTRLANYGPMLARPNSVGHLPAHWDHVAAVPASRFAGQHSPSFFASRPPFEFAEEHQQIWQTDSRLSSYPPSSAPGVLLPHQASSPTPYTVLQAQPWPRPPPPPVYDPRDWRPPASMQREPVLPSLWMPVTHEHQKQRFAVTEGDPRARTAPSDMSVSRADASVARPASMPTSDGGNFPSRVRRRSPMVAQSWWQ